MAASGARGYRAAMRAIGIAVVLAGLVALGAPAPTGAQAAGERVCVRQPPPAETRMIDVYIAGRKALGFRADEAYVRKLLRKGRWDSDLHWIPVTRREDAYLRLRHRLELGDAARRYLREHEDLDGGLSVEDDWPREPYLLQRLTRDRAKHTAALKRLARFPHNLRTKTVPLSYRQLRRIQRRIDSDAHEADGFHVSGSEVDITPGAVRVYLITKRTDHRAYFRARYGPHVRTRVLGTELIVRECAELVGWAPGATPAEIDVWWQAGGGGVFAATEVTEYPDRVEVAVIGEFPTGFRTSDWVAERHTITLAAPLGDRPVIGTTTGERLGRFEGFGVPVEPAP
jgi:hypothetical protein